MKMFVILFDFIVTLSLFVQMLFHVVSLVSVHLY